MRLTGSVVGCLLVVALASPTSAAPAKALCFQVKDDAGDARPQPGTTPAIAQVDSLDVLSADIATGTKNLVATVRLKTLAPEPYLVGGATYVFSFVLGGLKQEVYYKRTTSGAETAAYAPEGAASARSAVFAKDPAAATLTWTVPRKSVVGLKARGALISDLTVSAMAGTNFQDVGSGRGGSGIDSAAGTKAYRDGTKTCLKGT